MAKQIGGSHLSIVAAGAEGSFQDALDRIQCQHQADKAGQGATGLNQFHEITSLRCDVLVYANQWI